jgi:hypothetical protein
MGLQGLPRNFAFLCAFASLRLKGSHDFVMTQRFTKSIECLDK